MSLRDDVAEAAGVANELLDRLNGLMEWYIPDGMVVAKLDRARSYSITVLGELQRAVFHLDGEPI